MPTISLFFGIIIRMFFDDHAPPHFHAQYGEFKAVLSIRDLRVIEGELPRRALELVCDWAELHKDDLLRNWDLCREHQQPMKIEPLQ